MHVNFRYTAAVLFFGTSLAGMVLAEESRIPDSSVAAWVAKRVEAWQPTAAERRFDDTGWVTDIREAERLARQHDRPVFLFTHDGRMAIGRC
jgi:hypothetical protein